MTRRVATRDKGVLIVLACVLRCPDWTRMARVERGAPVAPSLPPRIPHTDTIFRRLLVKGRVADGRAIDRCLLPSCFFAFGRRRFYLVLVSLSVSPSRPVLDVIVVMEEERIWLEYPPQTSWTMAFGAFAEKREK